MAVTLRMKNRRSAEFLQHIDQIIQIISKTPAVSFVDPKAKKVLLEYWKFQREKVLLKKVKVVEEGIMIFHSKSPKEKKLLDELRKLQSKEVPLSFLGKGAVLDGIRLTSFSKLGRNNSMQN